MKIKKYQGETEEQVIEMAKGELGNRAIVRSIKKITPTGIFSIIKKPYIELIATYNKGEIEEKDKMALLESIESQNKDYIIKKLEKRVLELEAYLEKAMKNLSKNIDFKNKKYKNQLIQFIYEMLIAQGVLPSICDEILKEFDNEKNQNIDLVVKIVYNKIVKILERANGFILDTSKDNDNLAQNIVFLGTTGVGKTTTIAKLSSNIIMEENKNIGFITADTYRIAAIEQLKIYADILGCQVEVVYNVDEVGEKIKNLKNINDFIFFDTAGRSHKNKQNIEEIKELIEKIEKPQIYLVISSTSRFDDINNIITTYEKFSSFSIIFTKIDETDTLGSVLNVAYMTNKKISYITTGQNVPHDIEEFSAPKIAKVLLGSMYK